MTDQPTQIVPVFAPGMLLRQLSMDRVMRWGLLVGLVAAMLGNAMLPQISPMWWNMALVALVVVWIAGNIGSMQVARQLPILNSAIEQDPDMAEPRLAFLLQKRMLQRPVRLLLFHQLAALRHRQERFTEAATICQTVLEQMPPGRDDGGVNLPGILAADQHVRSQVLLLLVESRLQYNDLAGAYAGLISLESARLNLMESLQLLALRTQYEVTAGYDQVALSRLREKIGQAELMPAAQCGAVHALLGIAAARSGYDELADWLDARARLLCTPQQYENFMDRMAGSATSESV